MNRADPIDLKLNPADGWDILIDTDLHFIDNVADVGGVAQLIRIAVCMFMGEWFADLDEGIPYFARPGVPAGLVILGTKFREARVLASFRPVIAGVAGVAAIQSLAAAFNRPTRTVTVSWTVTTVFGDTVSDSLTMGNPNG